MDKRSLGPCVGLRIALAAASCTATLACSSPLPVGWSATGSVAGRVTLGPELARPAEPQPVVVYLERDGHYAHDAGVEPAVHISLEAGRLSPSFAVAAAGSTVFFETGDDVLHHVFSYSTPNDLDQGVSKPGESARVQLRYPGVVRLYCSMHPEMEGTIFVAPTRHYALVSRSGDYEISGVPAGEYRIRTWSPRLPRAAKRIALPRGQAVRVDLQIDKPASSP